MSRPYRDLEGLNIDKIIEIVSTFCSLSPNYIKEQIYNYWKDEKKNSSLTPFNREHYAAEYIYPIPNIIPDQENFEFPNSCFRGIDLPYWFDWNNSDKKKVFAIGLAAQRSKENWTEYQKGYFGQNTWIPDKTLNTNNSVILHSAWGANTTFAGHQMNNTLFTSLLDFGAISLYLTDYFKVFTKIDNYPIHKIRRCWDDPMYKQILGQELQETKPDVILIFSSSNQLRRKVTNSIRDLNIDLAPKIIQVPNLGAWQASMEKFLRTASLHEEDKNCLHGNGYYQRVARQIATHVINKIFPSNNFQRVDFQ